MRFQVHVVLIQDINKELLSHTNYTICHTLKEKNQCTNFLAKLGASSDVRHAWISSGWHARASRKQRNWNFFPPSNVASVVFSFVFFFPFLISLVKKSNNT
jgi:hypothetical protein